MLCLKTEKHNHTNLFCAFLTC